jgi:K+-sensing histidine kinase KdpD
MGIGLSIVDAIARAHGGYAHAVSEPGAGSTFVITLPAEPPGPDHSVRDPDIDIVPEPVREVSTS